MACGAKNAEPLRRRVCKGLAGEVVEIGFGSGHSVPFYPATVTRIAAVEPSDLAWKAGGGTGAGVDHPDRAGRPRRSVIALRRRQLRRGPLVLDPVHDPRRGRRPPGAAPRAQAGGTLHFVDHGLAPDERVQRWQRRLDGFEQRAFGGCHLTRPIVDLITDAGFTITELDVFYEKGAPKFAGADSLGVGVSP
jgi:hypothetical protein